MMNTWNPAEIMERLNHLESIVKGIPTPVDVVANPEGEASTDLEKLTVGETTYAIPEGTAVEANPEEEATLDLSKLGVDGVVYGIPSGGVDYASGTEVVIGKYHGKDLYMKEITAIGTYINDSDIQLMTGSNYEFWGIANDVSWFKEQVANAYFPISQKNDVTGVDKFYIKISGDRHTIYYHPKFASGGYALAALSIYVLYTKVS